MFDQRSTWSVNRNHTSRRPLNTVILLKLINFFDHFHTIELLAYMYSRRRVRGGELEARDRRADPEDEEEGGEGRAGKGQQEQEG